MKNVTFSMIKPDAVRRNIVGKIISRIENEGLSIAGIRLLTISRYQAESLYKEHTNHPRFEDLISYIASGPSIVMILKGNNAVSCLRGIIGNADPSESDAGTIRSDFGISFIENSIHATDSHESVKSEVEIFFKGVP